MTNAVMLAVVGALLLGAIALGDAGWALWVAAACVLAVWAYGAIPEAS
jgi:hypothetical protein